MVKVASVYKDLICEKPIRKVPKGLCKEVDVQEYATAQDMMESTCVNTVQFKIDKGNRDNMTTYRKVIP